MNAGQENDLNRLLELVHVHRQGELTDSEFEAAKERLLGTSEETGKPTEQGSEGKGSVLERLRKGASGLLERTGIRETSERIYEQTSETGKKVIEGTKEGIDRTYKTVTLRTFRDRIEEALAEIVEVLAAHEADIRAIRKKVGLPVPEEAPASDDNRDTDDV